MCTMISARLPIAGSARSAAVWTHVVEATLSYDHATHVWSEHALRIDFVPPDAPGADGVAIELDLASARSLVRRLQEIVAAAERTEAEERALAQ